MDLLLLLLTPLAPFHEVKFLASQTSSFKETETDSFTGRHDYLTPCDCTSVTITNLAHEVLCVYNRAVLFNPEDANNVTTDVDAIGDFPFYCAAIIFNMALCYHTLGSDTGYSRRLKEAGQLYETCYSILQDQLSLCGGTHLLLVACLNNQATICCDLVDRKFEALLHEMVKILQSFKSLTTEGKNGWFWMNTLLCPKTFYTAPCA